MSDRLLHPTQRQYLEILENLKAVQADIDPLLQEKARLEKECIKAVTKLVEWFNRHFPVGSRLCYDTILSIAPFIDASALPPDEPADTEANK